MMMIADDESFRWHRRTKILVRNKKNKSQSLKQSRVSQIQIENFRRLHIKKEIFTA